jgi:hypothetical protein
MDDLRVTVRLPGEPARRSSRFPVRVSLTNHGSAPVVVNRRLSIGYRDSLARELFVEVYRPGDADVVSGQALLYDRDTSTPDDYVTLEPGDEIAGSFDLVEWYTLPSEPGSYDLVVCYQADEPLAAPPPDILPGIHASERIRFELAG